MKKVLFSSNSEEWSTPQWLFDYLDCEFNFTLDPCATHDNHKCAKYYTKEDDGLSKSWKNEVIFCNPPYGRDISKWVKKCHDEWLNNGATCVLLIPARTDTLYFFDYILGIAQIRFIKGRLHFNDSKTPAPFPSLVCVFDPCKCFYNSYIDSDFALNYLSYE